MFNVDGVRCMDSGAETAMKDTPGEGWIASELRAFADPGACINVAVAQVNAHRHAKTLVLHRSRARHGTAPICGLVGNQESIAPSADSSVLTFLCIRAREPPLQAARPTCTHSAPSVCRHFRRASGLNKQAGAGHDCDNRTHRDHHLSPLLCTQCLLHRRSPSPDRVPSSCTRPLQLEVRTPAAVVVVPRVSAGACRERIDASSYITAVPHQQRIPNLRTNTAPPPASPAEPPPPCKMPPSSTRRVGLRSRREPELQPPSDADTPESISTPTRKKRRVSACPCGLVAYSGTLLTCDIAQRRRTTCRTR